MDEEGRPTRATAVQPGGAGGATKGTAKQFVSFRGLPPAQDIWISSGLRSRSIGAPRISGFWTVGFVWNSLDSLVRNEPFQWVTRDPGAIFNSCGPFPRSRTRRPGRPSIRRSTALNPLAQRKPPGAPESWRSTSQGSDRHWDETNTVFAFWQKIVVLSAPLRNVRAAAPLKLASATCLESRLTDAHHPPSCAIGLLARPAPGGATPPSPPPARGRRRRRAPSEGQGRPFPAIRQGPRRWCRPGR